MAQISTLPTTSSFSTVFRKSKVLGLFALLFYVSVAFSNLGIIALDDYSCIISQIIPAQHIFSSEVIANLGIRHPLAVLILGGFTRVLYRLGAENPIQQLRCTILVIGIFNFSVFTYFGAQFFKNPKTKNGQEWAVGLMGLFFLNPLIFTRPMIESLSAPFLFLACFKTYQYWTKNKPTHLVAAMAFLTLASMFRFQTGICFVAILLIIALKRDLRALVLLLLATGLAFVLSGLFEFSITGRFHGSVREYITYNIHYSSGYGTTPFYTFFVLLIGLTIPPTLFSRYKNFQWKKQYYELLPVLLFVFIFVIAHSIVPHKEERFLIPILPLFLIAIIPLLAYFTENKSSHWRIYWFSGINGVLLVLASFNTPQKNTINLVRYLAEKPEIKNIIALEDTLVLYPKVYAISSPSLHAISNSNMDAVKNMDCNTAFVIRADYESGSAQVLSSLTKLKEFTPGPLENIVIKLNPRQNIRRSSISLYVKSLCIK
ncbi:hypothetical protein EBQ74_00720 [bacterium]|nr:hypothetical protein [bacterium]